MLYFINKSFSSDAKRFASAGLITFLFDFGGKNVCSLTIWSSEHL